MGSKALPPLRLLPLRLYSPDVSESILGAADILRMVANFHSIKQNFPDSESFLMSEWTSKDVAVKDAAFNRLLKVICGPDNECAAGVRCSTPPCGLESRHLESRPNAAAILDLEVSAGWVGPSSRGLWGGDHALVQTEPLKP
jgi:hypothetical protein